MRLFAEHLPLDPKSSWGVCRKALCGEKRNPIVLNMLDANDPETFCRRCSKIACEDCGGTGITNSRKYGVYCFCEWGDVAKIRNCE